MDKYDLIVGLEIHFEPKTKSKMFCGCSANFWQKKPNTLTCPVCLGLPGALPVLNEKALELAIKTGLAVNCEVASHSKFDRKHYFYPDLPKGYQISQYDEPICVEGSLEIKNEEGVTKKIAVQRLHMEEDVAKSLHKKSGNEEYTLIDYNKSGVPLFELVTYPEMRSGFEAMEFAKKFQLILRYLQVSDADIEKGQMRCEPNISIQKKGAWDYKDGMIVALKDTKLFPKVEIKNIASTKFVKKAVDYEFRRLVEMAEKGEEIKQQTRGWNAEKNITEFQRFKESAEDYRYFPEPDIPELVIDQEFIEKIAMSIPDLPDDLVEKYTKEYELNETDIKIIVENLSFMEYFENILEITQDKAIIKEITKYLLGSCSAFANKNKVEVSKTYLKPDQIVELAQKVVDLKISKNSVPQILEALMTKSQNLESLIKELGAELKEDTEGLSKTIEEVISENPDPVTQFYAGKQEVLGFLMGKLMQKAKGSIEPQTARKALIDKLTMKK